MMESEPLQMSTVKTTCQLMHSRATCAVCGAPAIGRNFDAMTCLSCKAFFRRNAYNEHLIYTCRVSSMCEISMTTRRYCSACRLKKCFKQGMKKELIRSLSAINHATSLAATHRTRNVTVSPAPLDLLSHDDRSTLTFDDWNSLTNIRNAYEEYCIQPYLDSHQSIPPIPPKQPYRARLKLQRLVDLKYKHTIIIASYIKRILQCDAFPTSLEYGYPYLKDSFQCLITLNSCDLMKSKVLENVPWEHDRLALEAVLTGEVIERLGEILNTYQSLLPHDPIIMKLFVIILALSSRVLPLVRKAEYNAMDFKPLPRNFLASQNFYITLLWKYVVHRLGYNDAVLFSVRFIQTFLRRQRIEADIVDIVQSREDHGQLIHMMQMSMKI